MFRKFKFVSENALKHFKHFNLPHSIEVSNLVLAKLYGNDTIIILTLSLDSLIMNCEKIDKRKRE